MIVRILEEGQLEVREDVLDELNELDDKLVAAIDEGDEETFRHVLQELLTRVRAGGTPVPGDYIGPSDLVLPAAESTLDEVRALLTEEGLIPG